MTPVRSHQMLRGDGLRFLLAGGLNTLLTLAAYQALLFVSPAWMAYALSWVCGLLFVMIVYPSRVFAGARTDMAARARLGASYAILFLLGLGTLRLLGQAGVPARLAILGVLAVTTLSNFVLGRLALGAADRSDVDHVR